MPKFLVSFSVDSAPTSLPCHLLWLSQCSFWPPWLATQVGRGAFARTGWATRRCRRRWTMRAGRGLTATLFAKMQLVSFQTLSGLTVLMLLIATFKRRAKLKALVILVVLLPSPQPTLALLAVPTLQPPVAAADPLR